MAKARGVAHAVKRGNAGTLIAVLPRAQRAAFVTMAKARGVAHADKRGNAGTLIAFNRVPSGPRLSRWQKRGALPTRLNEETPEP